MGKSFVFLVLTERSRLQAVHGGMRDESGHGRNAPNLEHDAWNRNGRRVALNWR